MEAPESIASAYANDLLMEWNEIISAGQKFRLLLLNDTLDSEIVNTYVALLTRFWLELQPKMENRSEMGSLPKDYMIFKKYYLDPQLLTKLEKRKADGKMVAPNAKDIFEMEMVIRTAMEKLGLTRF